MKTVPPTRGQIEDAALRPYYATFFPIVISSISQLSQTFILSSNVMLRTAHEKDVVSSFKHFKDEGKQVPCNFKDHGKLVPVLDSKNTSLTFYLYQLETAIKVGDTVTIDCSDWFIHLTKDPRTLPISFALVHSKQFEDFGESDYIGEAYLFDLLQTTTSSIETWVQPAVYSGEPTPEEDEKKPKSQTLVIVFVVLIIIALLAGLGYFLYSKGYFNRFFHKKQPNNRLLSNEPSSYSAIQ